MRIELPPEHWVEVRESLKGRDRTAVHKVLQIEIQDGVQKSDASVVGLMQYALLASIITAWSFPEPIPALQGGSDAVAEMDIDHLDVLIEATADLLKKVSFKAPN